MFGFLLHNAVMASLTVVHGVCIFWTHKRVSIKSGLTGKNIKHIIANLYFYSNIIFNIAYFIYSEMNSTQPCRAECAEIDGNKMLLHQVPEIFCQSINICIANGGIHVEDVI